VDSSDAAKEVYFERCQTLRGMSAVPLNYIVGPDGRVADAFYDYDALRARRVLARLGVAAPPIMSSEN